MTAPVIRPARTGEGAVLTAIALRAKAVWGYDAAFMRACVPALTVPDAIAAGQPCFVADVAGTPSGYAWLVPDPPVADVWHFFVAPEAMGRGTGRALWTAMEAAARACGCTRLRVDADPNAAGFYEAMGMVRVGVVPSESIPGRMLPHLVKPL